MRFDGEPDIRWQRFLGDLRVLQDVFEVQERGEQKCEHECRGIERCQHFSDADAAHQEDQEYDGEEED